MSDVGFGLDTADVLIRACFFIFFVILWEERYLRELDFPSASVSPLIKVVFYFNCTEPFFIKFVLLIIIYNIYDLQKCPYNFPQVKFKYVYSNWILV